jgi:membrane associated rhomboid family serine protease
MHQNAISSLAALIPVRALTCGRAFTKVQGPVPDAEINRTPQSARSCQEDEAMFPPVIRTLIMINAAAFLAEMILGRVVIGAFALWPLGRAFEPWQLVTYAFLHASLAHIVLNMFGLSMFGADLEHMWGGRRFLIYYFVCVLSAGLTQLLVTTHSTHIYPTLGASGGVFGLLLAFAVYFPNRIVVLLFPPVPMPAWLFAAIYGAVELMLGVTGTEAGVAHFAHLGGMLGGYFFIRASGSNSRRTR